MTYDHPQIWTLYNSINFVNIFTSFGVSVNRGVVFTTFHNFRISYLCRFCRRFNSCIDCSARSLLTQIKIKFVFWIKGKRVAALAEKLLVKCAQLAQCIVRVFSISSGLEKNHFLEEKTLEIR